MAKEEKGELQQVNIIFFFLSVSQVCATLRFIQGVSLWGGGGYMSQG